jgi:hypothetical protein
VEVDVKHVLTKCSEMLRKYETACSIWFRINEGAAYKKMKSAQIKLS